MLARGIPIPVHVGGQCAHRGYPGHSRCIGALSSCARPVFLLQVLNEHFVPVKVDREERPEVDKV